MSSMQPLEFVSRASRLDRILRELLHQTPGVEAAAVVSFDGLPMASALPPEMDEDRVAAMSAALLSLAERAAQGLGRGDLSQVYIEGENGTVFLVSAQDEGVLIAVTAADAKVGMMLYEVKLAANRVGEVLHGPAPLPAPLPSHVTRGYLDAQDNSSNGRYRPLQEEPLYSELSHSEAPAETVAETLSEPVAETPAAEAADERTYSELDYSAPEYGEPEYSAPEYERALATAALADLESEDAPAEEAYAAHSPTDIPTDIPTTVAEYIDAAYAGTAAAALVENESAPDEAADSDLEHRAHDDRESEQADTEFNEPTTEHGYREASYYAESPEPSAPASEPAAWSSYAPSGSVLPGQGSW
jgi:predicted regulator of Ras-like GTPase activity (Roadblock/LC7/MglB family)